MQCNKLKSNKEIVLNFIFQYFRKKHLPLFNGTQILFNIVVSIRYTMECGFSISANMGSIKPTTSERNWHKLKHNADGNGKYRRQLWCDVYIVSVSILYRSFDFLPQLFTFFPIIIIMPQCQRSAESCLSEMIPMAVPHAHRIILETLFNKLLPATRWALMLINLFHFAWQSYDAYTRIANGNKKYSLTNPFVSVRCLSRMRVVVAVAAAVYRMHMDLVDSQNTHYRRCGSTFKLPHVA